MVSEHLACPPRYPHARTKAPVNSEPPEHCLQMSRGVFDGGQKGAAGFFVRVSDFSFYGAEGQCGARVDGSLESHAFESSEQKSLVHRSQSPDPSQV